MRYFRSIRLLRIIVSLTLLSVGSVTFVPAVRADSAGSRYAEWLRLHLPGGLLPQVQDALDRASEAAPRSFDDFLKAFLEEIISENSERSVGDLIIGEDVDDDTLIQELRRQFNEAVGTAVLNRQLEAASSARTDYKKKRPVRGGAALWGDPPVTRDRIIYRNPAKLGRFHCGGLLRSSAQPLGP
ncbi:MAG: hypothetical protein IIA50_00520 [Bacteroidetes bacterium]|nr:hypothetical protein [Bacteroidota bacterium]